MRESKLSPEVKRIMTKVNAAKNAAFPSDETDDELEPLSWKQPLYGFDRNNNRVVPEKGYALVAEGDVIKTGDKPFDIYAGWMESDGYHAKMRYHARSNGRWTCWERREARCDFCGEYGHHECTRNQTMYFADAD